MFFNRKKKKEPIAELADNNVKVVEAVKNDEPESTTKVAEIEPSAEEIARREKAYNYYKLFEKYFKYADDYEIHYEEALEYALKAAKCGLESGLYDIGNYYLRLRDATDADKERAFNAFKAGAELGGNISRFSLAQCYERGEGTTVDEEKAIYWYKEVLKNDNGGFAKDAMRRIEELEARNNSALAEKLAEKKAKEAEEERKGQKELEEYNNSEEGRRKLYERYLSGALEGYAVSQYSLGVCYKEGRGTAVDKGQALRWFMVAAGNGHLGAMYELARCYENGEGTAVNKPVAFYWYLKAARDGHETSQNIVKQISPDEAISYLNSVSETENEKLRSDAKRLKELIEFDLYKNGAENGNAVAMRNLSKCYEEGIGTDADPSQAFYWYKKAAEAGDADSQYHLGLYYEKGTGTEKDENQAFYWYKTASDNGHIDALYELATCYDLGTGVAKDLNQAFYLYDQLCQKGYIKAQYAMCYLVMSDLTPEQRNKAMYWLEQAGEADYSDSQSWLYTFYSHGMYSLKPDEKKALYWLEKLAEGGDIESQREAYTHYNEGIGTAVNKQKTVYYLSKIAEGGDMNAQIDLYNMYRTGKEGVQKDDKKTFYWCQKLAEEDFEQAYHNLALMYLKGEGTSRNDYKGFYWAKKAAEAGNVKGMEMLYRLYYDGVGTDADMSQYRYWYKMWKQSK
ncbi:MAG: SEL1-like repeat protein [Oscillospiraceae bacterium]|nr:SEL1-like repeat protein [Oscillospiraceae bacterium]